VQQTQPTEYCSFTKAIEQLGDRWCLLIVRELGMRGPKGFSQLAADLPGRISRSVLTDRLHRLTTLGLIARPSAVGSPRKYQLTSAGLGLMSVMEALQVWSADWLPEDPAMVEREPAVLLAWLEQRLVATRLPERAAVVEFLVHGGDRYWLVVAAGAKSYGCLTDPALDESRYVYVEAALPTLIAVARGRRSWAEVLKDGSAVASGAPDLARQMPTWFTTQQRRAAGTIARLAPVQLG
jgi:DNA-binding HxlR family transcriptional regulator